MFSFEFATANRIIFGAGKFNELGKQIGESTRRLLLVRGCSPAAILRVREMLSKAGLSFAEFQVHGEPTVEVIREGLKVAQGCDMIIGLGGGSILDTGKAIAALVTNS
jgi:alcohol dehydrogenase class IV